MNLYAYCLCQEMDWSTLETVTGVAGARPFVMPYDGIVAVVSKVDGSPIAVTRENVLSHERVISHVFAQTTPLPFRFGALLRPAEIDLYVASNRQALLAMLARVRGAVEMSVKIIHEAGSGGDAAHGRGEPAQAGEGIGRGAMFLAVKQRELAEGKMIEGRAREIANWLAEHLVGVVNDSFVRVRPTAGLAVKVAHLVERRGLDEYREQLKRAREERPELLFLTSGPWPPYSFCDLTT
jgi:hypothetical protein